MLVWSEVAGRFLPGPVGQEVLVLRQGRLVRTPLSSTARVAEVQEVDIVIDLNLERGGVRARENTSGGQL